MIEDFFCSLKPWQMSATSAFRTIPQKQVFVSTGKRGFFLKRWRDGFF
jgi:hypothetical protein